MKKEAIRNKFTLKLNSLLIPIDSLFSITLLFLSMNVDDRKIKPSEININIGILLVPKVSINAPKRRTETKNPTEPQTRRSP